MSTRTQERARRKIKRKVRRRAERPQREVAEAVAKARAEERERCADNVEWQAHAKCVHELCEALRRAAAIIRLLPNASGGKE